MVSITLSFTTSWTLTMSMVPAVCIATGTTPLTVLPAVGAVILTLVGTLLTVTVSLVVALLWSEALVSASIVYVPLLRLVVFQDAEQEVVEQVASVVLPAFRVVDTMVAPLATDALAETVTRLPEITASVDGLVIVTFGVGFFPPF